MTTLRANLYAVLFTVHNYLFKHYSIYIVTLRPIYKFVTLFFLFVSERSNVNVQGRKVS